jgi:hypothetical protein
LAALADIGVGYAVWSQVESLDEIAEITFKI